MLREKISLDQHVGEVPPMMMMFGSVLTAFLLEAVKRGLKMLFPLEKHKHLKMEHGRKSGENVARDAELISRLRRGCECQLQGGQSMKITLKNNKRQQTQ